VVTQKNVFLFRNRNLTFQNTKQEESHETIFLKDITTFQCLTDPLQPTTNGKTNSIGISFLYHFLIENS